MEDYLVKLKRTYVPFFLVSTHFHSLPKLLKHLEMYIEYATFQYDYDDEGQELVYFYKLKPG